MTGIADIHCHILPYVDDGALRKEESLELLEMQYAQGVRAVCATPHLRKGMFESTDDAIRLQFERLQERAGPLRERMRFFLSREYYCDEGLLARLERGEILPLGMGNCLLLEFSHAHSESEIQSYIQIVQQSGYRPLIAHLERCPALRGDTAQTAALVEMGALIQVNAGSILGREGRRQASFCRKLLKERLVHVVASDAHDPEMRPPELDRCAVYLTKKLGAAYAEQLLCTNPLQILLGREGETEDAVY